MTASLLPTVEIDPPGAARHAVIWLHGLGADGHDFEPIVPALGVDPALAVRFVFPHAPARPVTINAGMVMPAWYDIRELSLRRDVDEQGLLESAAGVRALVGREGERGIPPERIVLAGFSQGGAVALYTALRHPRRLAGILALSTYLLGDETLESERSAANRETPVFQAHGELDPMVPIEAGTIARDRLLELGQPHAWHAYRMGHEVCVEEIRAVGNWLNATFGVESDRRS